MQQTWRFLQSDTCDLSKLGIKRNAKKTGELTMDNRGGDGNTEREWKIAPGANVVYFMAQNWWRDDRGAAAGPATRHACNAIYREIHHRHRIGKYTRGLE